LSFVLQLLYRKDNLCGKIGLRISTDFSFIAVFTANALRIYTGIIPGLITLDSKKQQNSFLVSLPIPQHT